MANSMFSSIIASYKSTFVPTIEESMGYTFSGNLAVYHKKTGAYTAFIDDELCTVPSEMIIKAPVYLISKPISDLKIGDIIKTKSLDSSSATYSKITKIENGKVHGITFNGNDKKVIAIKDVLTQQKTIPTVLNLFGQLNTSSTSIINNPMLMLALAKDENGDEDSSLKSMLPLLMMQNGGGTTNAQSMMPLMMMMSDRSGDNDMWLAMAMMQGGGTNPFAGLFKPVENTIND